MIVFNHVNKLSNQITGFSVNTPEDLKELLGLLKEKDAELMRLAKIFDLEYLLQENKVK